MDRIGFIGTGLMGHGMAANLLAQGYPVTVIAHRNRTPVEDLVRKGASEATDLASLAASSDIIHICAPGSPQVEAIIAELAPHLAKDSIIIDCSTSDPTSTVKLAQDLSAQGIHMADAPLGGTPVQAAEGKLAAMVGAAPEIFTRINPVIACWAGTIAHIGGPGDGHKMKLLNNFLSMGYGAMYAEALAVAESVGISTKTFDSVIRGSRMDCGFYQTFMGYAVEGNREAHKFTLTNARKDMRYLANMATAAGVDNPVGAAVKGSFEAAVEAGGSGPEDYVPHLVDYVARANGVTRATD